MLDGRAVRFIDEAVERPGRIVALTGAGISAESGIPTFRGPEGYWTVGSKVHRPMELATWATFRREPELVWPWYLWRRRVCRQAEPNAAHRALVALEQALGERFVLVTQNVDGLHARAGSRRERTYAIHGEIDRMRCAVECCRETWPVPDDLDGRDDPAALADGARDALRCPTCGGWTRPHVLWFDETYDEPRYRFDSALRAAREATLLLVVGTSGATTLPVLMAQEVLARRATLVDVNAGENPFGVAAAESGLGVALVGAASIVVPAVVARVLTRAAEHPEHGEAGDDSSDGLDGGGEP